MKINSYYRTEIGKVRKANEDFCGQQETINGHVFVVCDGMGGHVGGARASQIAVQSLLEFFSTEEFENIILAIDRAFQFANEQIFANAQADPSLQGMGTTAVLLIIKGENCFIGHVGDSRIYLKTDGVLHRLTKDHSYVQGLVDQGIISDHEAESHPKRNQILKALGHSMDVQGTVCQQAIKVKSGDAFLLCSDGLNGMIGDEQINRCIDIGDLMGSVNRLYQSAMDNRGADNITAMVVLIEQSSHSGPSQFVSFNPRVLDATLTGLSGSSGRDTAKPTKKNKWIVPLVAGLVVLALAAFGYFYFLRDTKITDSGSGSGDTGEMLYKVDLEKRTLKELQGLVGTKTKTNVGDGTSLQTADGKGVKLSISDSSITKVEALTGTPPPYTPPTTPGADNPNPKPSKQTILVGMDQKIKDLMIQIKKDKGCDPVSENELYELNKPFIEGDSKLTPGQKSNYKVSRVVPQGFNFHYRCKPKEEKPKENSDKKDKTGQVKTYPTGGDIKISELRAKLTSKECTPVSVNELYELNKPFIEGDSKLTPGQKSNYKVSRVVPQGFSFRYKCQ
ncbi:MAG: Stp1/IreP family PP2C-type Ser/Thr phosphatase [Bacteroidetes bacterium]|nr:Stp1/IreP family PP2C-type Ser/Thr phosphatase [Bacteroidota bacterium]